MRPNDPFPVEMQDIAAVREVSGFDTGIQGVSEGIRNPPATKPGAEISSLAARLP